jgi:chemotaxis protein methyltransferase CheR
VSLALHRTRASPDKEVLQVHLLGQVEGDGEGAELCALLASPAAKHIEILCFDAEILPVTVIEAIAGALDQGVDVKVRAYRPLLAFGLRRLSLPVLPVTPEASGTRLEQCRVLALVGSANSLDKILYIVEHLPLSNASIFILQHISADQPNLLDKLLKVRTGYSVFMPHHLTRVEEGAIYIAPPGHHMKVAHGLVYLTRDREINFARPSIDALLTSLAGEYGDQVLAALLCGYGQDGIDGSAAIASAGGCVLVEDTGDCEGASVLPQGVIDAEHFDHRLGLKGLTSICAAALSQRDQGVADPLLGLFLEALYELTGYDFRSYQRGTLTRRIGNLVSQGNYPSLFDFQRAALSMPLVTQRLLTELSINVSEFFRHPEQFRDLHVHILPFLASFPMIKIWSAGCATGEEAYSLAFLLDEIGLFEKSRIFATDINPYLIELAQAGLYPRDVLERSRENHRVACNCGRFPQRLEDKGRFLKVAQRYRKRLLFHHHALGQDGSFNEFQLIVCRNVMIYFDIELQRRVLALFAVSLHREGYLLLGPSDGLRDLARESGFRPHPGCAHLYRYSGQMI